MRPFANVDVAVELVVLRADAASPPVNVEVPAPCISMMPVVVAFPPKKELPDTERVRVGDVVPIPSFPWSSSLMRSKRFDPLFVEKASTEVVAVCEVRMDEMRAVAVAWSVFPFAWKRMAEPKSCVAATVEDETWVSVRRSAMKFVVVEKSTAVMERMGLVNGA